MYFCVLLWIQLLSATRAKTMTELGFGVFLIEVGIPHEAFSERMNCIKGAGSHRYGTRQKRKDGTSLYVEVSAAYMPDSRKLLEFTRDVTR